MSNVRQHMQPPEFHVPLDLAAFLGREIIAYAQEEDYWHLVVALRAGANDAFVFTSEERSVAKRFEVFPIRVVHEEASHKPWRILESPFLVIAATALWRYEWIEAGAIGPTLGSDPNTQYAGPGPAPLWALSAARVLAGVLLESASGACIVVAASDSAPLNVELYLTREAVLQALQRFERLSPNPSIERTF